jgi:hypothetical protein
MVPRLPSNPLRLFRQLPNASLVQRASPGNHLEARCMALSQWVLNLLSFLDATRIEPAHSPQHAPPKPQPKNP